MTEAEWLEGTEAPVLLSFPRGSGSDPPWGRYASGCCRAARSPSTRPGHRPAAAAGGAGGAHKRGRGGFCAGPRARARLAVLGDALEEAGCTNEPILTHLRGPGPHVRGCWALDALLGQDAPLPA